MPPLALERRAEEGYAALIRLSAREGFVLWAPPMTGGRGWVEKHTVEEKVRALGKMSMKVLVK